jgi:hemolysin-activating ACP:hemolysin acyltransferase
MNEQHVLQAMQSIRAHLARSPRAGDTVKGIHMWWIDWTEPIPHAAVTEQALQRLAAQGLVQECVMEDGTGVWRRCQADGQ